MGSRSFDKGPPLTVVVEGATYYETRVIRDSGTVYVVARTAHYPDHPTAGHPKVVLLWSGVAEIVALAVHRWEIRRGPEVIGSIQRVQGGCGCNEPIKSWRP